MRDKPTLEQKSHIERKLLEQRPAYEAREKHGSFPTALRLDSDSVRGNNLAEGAADENLGAYGKLRNHSHQMLARINHCLMRLNGQLCGACIECGEKIGYDRKVVSPLAERCLSCKILFEKAALGQP